MKKILAILLAVFTLLLFASCAHVQKIEVEENAEQNTEGNADIVPYDIALTRSSFQAEGEHEDISAGEFSISFDKGDISVQGDAELFDTHMYFDGETYSFSIKLYQYQGLFYSGTLLKKLDTLIYKSYDEQSFEPHEKYSVVNHNITIMINGNLAKNVAVSKAGGNGHVDYFFKVSGLPKVSKEELKEIRFILKKQKTDEV